MCLTFAKRTQHSPPSLPNLAPVPAQMPFPDYKPFPPHPTLLSSLSHTVRKVSKNETKIGQCLIKRRETPHGSPRVSACPKATDTQRNTWEKKSYTTFLHEKISTLQKTLKRRHYVLSRPSNIFEKPCHDYGLVTWASMPKLVLGISYQMFSRTGRWSGTDR